MKKADEHRATDARILNRAWKDKTFKKRLLEDPHGALKDEGIKVPKGVRLKVVENTAKVRHMVIPKKPRKPIKEEELSSRMGADFCICF